MSTGDILNQKPCFLRLWHLSPSSDSDINLKCEMNGLPDIRVHVHSPTGQMAFTLLAGHRTYIQVHGFVLRITVRTR